MTILLIRHCAAGDRHRWDGDDDRRPLDDRGQDDAVRLAKLLAPYEVKRVLSSPALRCIDTVRPLAETVGAPVEERPELAEGEGRRAVELIRALAGDDAPEPTAVSTHGDVVPRVLTALAVEDGLDLGADPHWRKGSTWVLEIAGGRFVRARYLEPPS